MTPGLSRAKVHVMANIPNIEFAPKRRRIEDEKLNAYPNTLTVASVVRAAQERANSGRSDFITELQLVLEGAQRWKRGELPGVGPAEPVTVRLGHTDYAYLTPSNVRRVVIGDVLAVPGIAGETTGEVVALTADYDGPMKYAHRVAQPVYGVI